MTIDTEVINKATAVLKLSGRLDTANAALLEQKIRQWGSDITMLILDFEKLDYISSMGLRVLLSAKKASKEKNREFVIRNMCEAVREVFEIAGFINLIVREEGFAVVRGDEGDAILLSLNGKMGTENIPAVQEELAAIRRQRLQRLGVSKVILDMRKLYCILPGALRHLNQAIADTAWEGRDLSVRNAPLDYLEEIESLGMGELAREAEDR